MFYLLKALVKAIDSLDLDFRLLQSNNGNETTHDIELQSLEGVRIVQPRIAQTADIGHKNKSKG